MFKHRKLVSTKQFSIRSLILMLTAISLFLAFVVFVRGQYTGLAQFKKVQVGMSKEEISSVLGKPHRVSRPDVWHYNVWGIREQVLIEFGNNGSASTIYCYSIWGENGKEDTND